MDVVDGMITDVLYHTSGDTQNRSIASVIFWLLVASRLRSALGSDVLLCQL